MMIGPCLGTLAIRSRNAGPGKSAPPRGIQKVVTGLDPNTAPPISDKIKNNAEKIPIVTKSLKRTIHSKAFSLTVRLLLLFDIFCPP